MRCIDLDVDSGRQLQLELHEDYTHENCAGVVVWDAALALIHYLAINKSCVAGQRVLELGCGTGAVGCAAAALGARAVTCTDLPDLLPLVRRNIEANRLSEVAAAEALPWGEPLPAAWSQHPPFDLVLASDVCYLADTLPLLVHTLLAACAPHTRVLLCNEHRPALPFPRHLFEEAGFEVQPVPLEEQHPDWCSKDIHLFRIRLLCRPTET